MARIAGTVYLYVDGGEQYSVNGSVSISGFSSMKEAVVGLSGVEGYSEKPRAPFVEVTLLKRASDKFAKFAAMDNVTVTVETAVGTATLKNAFVSGEPSYNPETAELTIKFEGDELVE